MIYDYLINNGWIVDGTGNPWYKAALAIHGHRIASIGKLASTQADKVIDAAGLIVAPGFIDIHQHSEIHLIIHPQSESRRDVDRRHGRPGVWLFRAVRHPGRDRREWHGAPDAGSVLEWFSDGKRSVPREHRARP